MKNYAVVGNRKFIITVLLLSFSFPIIAQQDPIYAQYLNNPLIMNPAYAGSNNMFNANLQYRTQWAGLEGSPSTINFNAHSAVLRNKGGIGLMVVQDKLGDTKNTEFNLSYAYKIALNNASLSFGMQTGFIRYNSNLDGLNIQDGTDQAFAPLTETKFNTGAGVILKSDKYMVGLSVPRLLPATVSQDGGQTIELYKQHYYLFGSYVIFVTEDIRFKPSLLLRGTSGSPFSADINASFNIKELYTAGLFTRNFKSYGLLLQAIVKNIRFGYVFELPGSKASNLNFTSHEFTIGLSMGVLGYHDRVVKTF